MARSYSQDLRDRVIDAALSGTPSGAPRAFRRWRATAIVWVRRAREGGDATPASRVSRAAASSIRIAIS